MEMWWSRSSAQQALVDPQIVVKPIKGQIDDLLHEINIRAERNERVLVTTLTKKMSEDLTDYLQEKGVQSSLSALRGRHDCVALSFCASFAAVNTMS